MRQNVMFRRWDTWAWSCNGQRTIRYINIIFYLQWLRLTPSDGLTFEPAFETFCI
jgi:hypothetical protein